MKTKLENLISLEDFKANWQSEKAKKTKRTDTGLDIIKEDIEEIIPEGPEDNPLMRPKYGTDDEKIEMIKNKLDDLDEGYIDEILDYLREVLLEMEQMGFVDEETTDELDDKHDGDWISWIKDVIELPDFDEGALNGILDIISNAEDYPNYSDEEEVECPDCEGTGSDENGDDCDRCEGSGMVNRPDDIPPDEPYFEEE
jgi:hypothetical protein